MKGFDLARPRCLPALLRLAFAAQLSTMLLAPACAQQAGGHGRDHDAHGAGSGWHGSGAPHQGNPGWHGGSGAPRGGSPPWHGSSPPWHGGAGPRPGPRWHGDIGHFNQYDRHIWRGGHWQHGTHYGHNGWWWVVGGTWYPYAAPIYPYPDPFLPSVVVPSVPPGVAVVPQYWYYCPELGAYYPYAPGCPGGWMPVPATVR